MVTPHLFVPLGFLKVKVRKGGDVRYHGVRRLSLLQEPELTLRQLLHAPEVARDFRLVFVTFCFLQGKEQIRLAIHVPSELLADQISEPSISVHYYFLFPVYKRSHKFFFHFLFSTWKILSDFKLIFWCFTSY